MPPKYNNGNRSNQSKDNAVSGRQGGVSYAAAVQAPASGAGKKENSVPSVDLNSSSPDELQAQMKRLLSEVDRVRNALEQRKGANGAGGANSPAEDEDDEVLRLQFASNAASVSLDDDQPQSYKKTRGFSPTTSNAVAKAFSQHEHTGTVDKRGGSPLMDQQQWLQKMLRQIPAGNSASSAPTTATAARPFQSPPPLPAGNTRGHESHNMSTLSSVPDTSAISEQDQMWGPGPNEQNVWQHSHPHLPHHGGLVRGRGAVYTNPHRTGTMSYRQNHHHDSTGDGKSGRGRGGYGNGLFSDDFGTKDYVIVEFKRERTKKYPCSIKVQPGEYVIVDGDRGQDCGLVIQVAHAKDDGTFEVQCIDAMLKNYVRTKPERARVLRVATPDEVNFLHSDIDNMEKAALQTCKAKCDELGITDLKLVDCEFQFDRQKVSFFFDSERSIDFRALVRDLHRAFGIRIWMENINPGVKNSVPADAQADIMWTGEDSAHQRMLGGLGMGVGGSTTMMMSGAPLPTMAAGYRGRGSGRGQMRR